ncbi:MAG: hypothetical protein NC078_08055 [Ruminococcus sp.]|nr:hypothetical protein [Ruminococcus sp.]
MEFDDYRGNSHKSKETPVKVKTIRKIANGKIAPQSGLQKIAEEFIAENAANVKDYIWHDVIVPAIKGMIADTIHESTSVLLGEQCRSTGNRKGSYISYDSKSDRYGSSRRSYIDVGGTSEQSRRSSVYRFDNIIVPTRGEAEDILFTMEECISEYGFVTVADLFDLAGLPGRNTDTKYGWKSIEGADIVKTRDGYLLRFPKPRAID